MPILFNASPEVLRCQHGGMFTVFSPGEEKEIPDVYASKHMVNRWGKYGLVELNFGKKESKLFDDYDVYVHSQKIVGLKNYLEMLEQKLFNFNLYDQECGDKPSIPRINNQKLAELVKKNIIKTKENLARLEKIDPRKTDEEKAAIFLKEAEQLKQKANQLLGKSSGENIAKSAGRSS